MKTCPVCKKLNPGDEDHRKCILQLFKEKKIQSVADWERMCKPVQRFARRTILISEYEATRTLE